MGTPVETNYQPTQQPTQQPTTNNAKDEEFSVPRFSQHCSGQTRPWSCSSWRPSCCPPSTSSSPSCRPPSTSNSPSRCPRSPAYAPQPGSPCGGRGGPEDPGRVGGVRAQVLHPAGRSEGCRPGGDSQRRGGLHCVRPHQ